MRNFIHISETDSTNLMMLRKHENGENINGSVISTDFQNAGKGLDTNKWHSSKAQNLLFSLAIKPDFLAPSEQFLITKIISLSLAEVLSHFLPGATIRIKWPNDIYVHNKKIAGILISNIISGNSFEFSIIGIGLNVNETKFPDWIPNPVSMFQIFGKEFDRDSLLPEIIATIDKGFKQVRMHKDFDLFDEKYLDKLLYFKEWHNYIINGVLKSARIIGITGFGQLMLETENGEINICDLKEVVFL
jgi:BirA family transcriptional regulator, biotin operon repressor / biotin---[acetyl-CoA-carboxylase] ligase